MKKVLFWSLPSMCIYFCSCYDITANHQLSIINKTQKDIAVLYSNNISPVAKKNNVAFYLSDQSITRPDSTRDIIRLGGKDAWHNYIEEGKAKKLFLYVFDTDTLKKYNNVYSMYELVSQHRFFKLLTYSENYLNKVNWQVTIR